MTDAPGGAPFRLERFELVLLRRPAARVEVTEDEAERLKALHLGHLGAMAAEGHLVLAGPFDEQPDESMRGLCLYRTGSLERTRSLAEDDPAVSAGRLQVEVMYFWCEEGVVRPRPANGPPGG